MLSPAAFETIHNYLVLPFGNGRAVAAPYYNNRRGKLRGALRVLVGKGSPDEIVEEALIISLRDKIDLEKLSDEELKKFLVHHRLGVDCSGFAYHVLDSELKYQGKGGLKKYLAFTSPQGLLRKLLLKLRTAENTSVKVLASDANSTAVAWTDAEPGDLVIMLGTNPAHDYDHVLVIIRVEGKPGNPERITYAHSLQWSSDGLYDHGARQGVIEITNLSRPLTEQRWIEKEASADANETLHRAREAQTLAVRRLRALQH